jgi:hypothetical protein
MDHLRPQIYLSCAVVNNACTPASEFLRFVQYLKIKLSMRILTHSEQTWAPTPNDWLWGSLNSHNTTCSGAAWRGSDTERGKDIEWGSDTSPCGCCCDETTTRLLVAVAAAAEQRGEGEEQWRRGREREGHEDGDKEKSDLLQSPAPVRFRYSLRLREDKWEVYCWDNKRRKHKIWSNMVEFYAILS